MPRAYYNEIDPYAAQWLRNLIAAGEIAPGDVDERDLRDVRPADLDGYTQCHFFAGIGVWSRALRSAGWPDDRPVWTGSCPCQPFSAAGSRAGFDDERHVWPDWHWLIEQCRPETVFGEQVASADGLGWLDLVSSDMEATDYAIGAVDTCAAGFRSFHIRQRLYFAAYDLRLAAAGMGDTSRAGPQGRVGNEPASARREDAQRHAGLAGNAVGMADATGQRWNGRTDTAGTTGRRSAQDDGAVERVADSNGRDARAERQQRGGQQRLQSEGCGLPERVDHAASARHEQARIGQQGQQERRRGRPELGRGDGRVGNTKGVGRDGRKDSQDKGRGFGASGHAVSDVWSDPSDGYWRDADWLFCRDGVWRPVGPGLKPLASKATARVVAVCSRCKTETVSDEEMRVLRYVTCGDERRQQAQVLLAGLHGQGSAFSTSNQSKHGSLQGEGGSKSRKMLSVRGNEKAARPSQGSEPTQRQSDELGSAMCEVPRQGTQTYSHVGVCRLWPDFSGSVSQESEQDLFCPVCERVESHECKKTVGSKAGQLRAYGNGLDLAQATGFIRAYLERDLGERPVAGNLFEWGA